MNVWLNSGYRQITWGLMSLEDCGLRKARLRGLLIILRLACVDLSGHFIDFVFIFYDVMALLKI